MFTTAFAPSLRARSWSASPEDRKAHSQPAWSDWLKKLAWRLAVAVPKLFAGLGCAWLPKKSRIDGSIFALASAVASASASGRRSRSSRARADPDARRARAAIADAVSRFIADPPRRGPKPALRRPRA